jgi:pyruvate/2-oxoglutarate dehydrogenase complex dihydrolipoamide acyltransferase (E2) component
VKPRYLLLGAAVLVLAGLNVLRWSSTGEPARARAAASPYAAEDFRLRTGTAAAQRDRSGRDLFRPKLPPPSPAPKLAAAPPEPPPAAPPAKTPGELAEEAARDELRQLKLVGVVFRGGKGQAFVVKGDQAYLVHAGEKVGERFRVEAIAPDGIQLLDPASRVNGQIPVSGK